MFLNMFIVPRDHVKMRNLKILKKFYGIPYLSIYLYSSLILNTFAIYIITSSTGEKMDPRFFTFWNTLCLYFIHIIKSLFNIFIIYFYCYYYLIWFIYLINLCFINRLPQMQYPLFIWAVILYTTKLKCVTILWDSYSVFS